jgi:hypothetical protein
LPGAEEREGVNGKVTDGLWIINEFSLKLGGHQVGSKGRPLEDKKTKAILEE